MVGEGLHTQVVPRKVTLAWVCRVALLVSVQEVDKALGRSKPPAVEYILVMPFANLRLPFGLGISYNAYGHAAVRCVAPSPTDCSLWGLVMLSPRVSAMARFA